jgi:GH15 family glucan-1,4-alpha-glucosidase
MVTPFAPLRLIDGYLPIEDHGLIGDGTTAALIGRDGAVSWLCVPRFDSPPLFCRLLDAKRGGAFTVTPEELVEARQFYEPDSSVLVTELRSRSGLIRLTDALTLRSGANLAEDVAAGRAELLRSVRVLQGRVRVRIEVEPLGGIRAERHAGGFQLRCETDPERDLWLFSTGPLEGLRTVRELKAGDHLYLMLRCG